HDDAAGRVAAPGHTARKRAAVDAARRHATPLPRQPASGGSAARRARGVLGRSPCATERRGRGGGTQGTTARSRAQDAVEREIFLAAAPAIVFGFLIDPTLMAEWIGLFHTLDPRPGGVFQVEVSRGNVARGLYTEVIPFRRVAFTWGWETQDQTLAV